MKIEPGDLCAVTGGLHAGCNCMLGRLATVTTRGEDAVFGWGWFFAEELPCRRGLGGANWCQEHHLQPMKKPPAEEPSEARKTELDKARWVVEKA